VLIVSALAENKRVELGIRAVGQISDAHLVVAGDGPLRHELDAAAAKMLPARFSRLSVEPHLMPALYRSADVLLHLAKEESFGNIFLEAIACGLPVTAPDTARVRWIVGENEFLFNDDDPTAIAEQVLRALRAPASLREQRTLRAYDFSWRKIALSYRQFFDDIIKKGF